MSQISTDFDCGKISDIHSAVKIALACGGRFYRGHSSVFAELTPNIFRKCWKEDWTRYNNRFEDKLWLEFRRNAPLFLPDTPKDDDHLGWLLRMQHHGTPTRLLDWSQSILTALYFAVSDQQTLGVDGELWVLNPEALNKETTNGFALVFHNSQSVQYLAKVAFYTSNEELMDQLHLVDPPTGPIAFLPPNILPRMVAQSSAFTIHPGPVDTADLCRLLAHRYQLGRYLLPAAAKKDLRVALLKLGINKRVLFPELDSVSAAILETRGIFSPEKQEPPCVEMNG